MQRKNSEKNQGRFERKHLKSAIFIYKMVYKLCKTVLSGITNFCDAEQSGLFLFPNGGDIKDTKEYR